MKKLLTTVLLAVLMGTLMAQTTGELNVTVTTSETGGNYAPAHVVAIWIEDGQGNFVKTLLAYAATRKTHLNTWQASTNNAGDEFNTVDAITGATKYSHETRNCSWDGTDYLGIDMPDGDYTIWMELTDKNATGNYSSFSFTKGPNDASVTPDNAPSFSDVQIVWTAYQSGIVNPDLKVKLSPNPGNGIFQLDNMPNRQITVFNLTGKVIHKHYGNQVDISSQPAGIYLIQIDAHPLLLKYIKSK